MSYCNMNWIKFVERELHLQSHTRNDLDMKISNIAHISGHALEGVNNSTNTVDEDRLTIHLSWTTVSLIYVPINVELSWCRSAIEIHCEHENR